MKKKIVLSKQEQGEKKIIDAVNKARRYSLLIKENVILHTDRIAVGEVVLIDKTRLPTNDTDLGLLREEGTNKHHIIETKEVKAHLEIYENFHFMGVVLKTASSN
jgi:hypothetical protein